jgi:hypothetical protein
MILAGITDWVFIGIIIHVIPIPKFEWSSATTLCVDHSFSLKSGMQICPSKQKLVI